MMTVPIRLDDTLEAAGGGSIGNAQSLRKGVGWRKEVVSLLEG
jgi:hypothetical protein